MPDFRNKPGSKSANLTLKRPVADIETFAGLVQSLIHTNPLAVPRTAHGGGPILASRQSGRCIRPSSSTGTRG